jgi:hypothetical protein
MLASLTAGWLKAGGLTTIRLKRVEAVASGRWLGSDPQPLMPEHVMLIASAICANLATCSWLIRQWGSAIEFILYR